MSDQFIYQVGVFLLGLLAAVISFGFIAAAHRLNQPGFLIVALVFICLTGLASYMLMTWPTCNLSDDQGEGGAG